MEIRSQPDETQARIAADRLMADVRSGVLKPGHPLRIAALKKQYGIGASPLREALLLMTSLGYATGESHRGYRVAEMSREDLQDITRAREVIETGMLSASMAAADDDWEVGILTAMERLRRAVAKGGAEGFRDSPTVALAHKQLHAAIVCNCNSPRLMNMQALLFDQAQRYRDIMIRHVPAPDDFVETHDQLVKVILSGDVCRASIAMREHLSLTPRNVYQCEAVEPDPQVPHREQRRG